MLSLNIYNYWLFSLFKYFTFFAKKKKIKISTEKLQIVKLEIGHLLKEEKRGVNNSGTHNGRSGGHGVPYKRVGAKLIRLANKIKNDPELQEAYKREGKRLLEKGKSINHF